MMSGCSVVTNTATRHSGMPHSTIRWHNSASTSSELAPDTAPPASQSSDPIEYLSSQATPLHYALALGRAETCACQRRKCPQLSGTESLTQRAKSTAINVVMSATL